MDGGTGTADASCSLTATPIGGSSTVLDSASARASSTSGAVNLQLPLQALVTFAVPHNLFLACGASATGGTPSFTNPKLSAIQVNAIH
jgi:hypothetical protein